MGNNIFNDFVTVERVPQNVLDYYQDRLPQELLDVWEKYGFGTMLDGYLKIVNPVQYQEILNLSYFRADVAIPIFVTGFGDIITWQKNKFIFNVRFKDGTFHAIASGFKFFWGDLNDEDFLEENFELNLYYKAVELHGNLAFDECFGFVPLLGLGGPKKVENLKKVKIREHIELITALVGGIGR